MGAKGYSSYRGRGSRWKILMAIVLVLIIAVAASVIYMQQYLVYSADGRWRIDLPWLTDGGESLPPPESPEDDPLPGLDIVVQEPETPETEEFTAFSLPAQALTQAAWQEALAAKPEGCQAVAVRLKTPAGTVYFNAEGAASGAVDTAADTAAALSAVTSQAGLYTIASLSCLQDFKAATADVEGRGLKNTGGYIFYDGNNSLWLDPAKPSTREYVCGLAREVAELGFDELLLTDFSYPTVGKINKISYNTEVPLANNLDLLLGELKTALEPYEIVLSLEIPEKVITEGPDTVAGLDLSRLVSRVDRIYAVTTADQVENLSNLVAQAAGADGKTAFVPELTADSPSLTGSRLLLAE